MSAAIARIDASLAKVHARLKAMHWESEERKATNEASRGKDGSAAVLWAEICGLRVQAWKEEAERT